MLNILSLLWSSDDKSRNQRKITSSYGQVLTVNIVYQSHLFGSRTKDYVAQQTKKAFAILIVTLVC